MTLKVTANEIRSLESNVLDKIIYGTTEDGSEVEVLIPSLVGIALAQAIQSHLVLKVATFPNQGGAMILIVTNVGHWNRHEDHSLVLQTDRIGTLGFQMTNGQWQMVSEIAAAALKDAPSVQ